MSGETGLARVDAYLAAHSERFLSELFTLLRQPSISAQNVGMAECADLLSGLMRQSGIATEIVASGGYPVVCGQAGPADGPAVLVYGHYDVQAPEPLDAWLSPPFEPTIRNGKIFGRGTSDNKAQLFIFLKAVEILNTLGGALPIQLKFLIEGEEEIGSPNLADFARANRDRLAADMTVFSDSHIHASGRPVVTLGVKGMLYVELIARGASRDHHSMHAGTVENPAWKLVWALNSLKAPPNRVLLPGFYDAVRVPEGEEKRLIASIPSDEGEMLASLGVSALMPGRIEDGYHWNLVTEPTFNIAGLNSGYAGPGAKTVLPCVATAKIDIRLVPDMSPADILDKLQRHIDGLGVDGLEVREIHRTPPARTPLEHPALPVIVEALRAAYGSEPIIYPSMGGVGPNYVFTDILGQPCFGVPHATFDQANHAPNESMDLAGFFNGIRTTVRMLSDLPGVLR